MRNLIKRFQTLLAIANIKYQTAFVPLRAKDWVYKIPKFSYGNNFQKWPNQLLSLGRDPKSDLPSFELCKPHLSKLCSLKNLLAWFRKFQLKDQRRLRKILPFNY